ncbi:hypothetical protein [Rhizobium rhizogenes]|uniref:hypothetical protein n=1 Tax=Rhizobium rhizogenes TaxID=359 RepID=UPI00059FBF33|nr:hypothetical protein [Rhizobium rhizogenes]NTG06476.1 hypothetical protein [Rhizobium rhizogenes]
MPTKPLVRSLADADPGYVAAKSLVDKLTGQRSKLDAEENDLLDRLRNRPAVSEMTARVAALLGDEPPSEDAEPNGLRARLTAIAVERVDLQAALEHANQRLAVARYAASKTVCAEVRGEYSARVQRLAKALITAAAESAALDELSDALEREDIAWSGHLPPLRATRVVGHRGDRVAGWLREAATTGFIKRTDIPKELQV